MRHVLIENMVFEAIVENLLVAKYSIEFRKDSGKWGGGGCYGYPALILLFSIADTLGSFTIGGNTRKHFEILNDQNYYDLRLSKLQLDEIYENYRCLVTHNGVLPIGRVLDIGNVNDPIYSIYEKDSIKINLLPFWIKSYYCVQNFIKSTSLENNPKAKSILEIPLPLFK